ncbi:hypothetical protein ACA910_014002 [Epithemia clementina (nom. ined.)]
MQQQSLVFVTWLAALQANQGRALASPSISSSLVLRGGANSFQSQSNSPSLAASRLSWSSSSSPRASARVLSSKFQKATTFLAKIDNEQDPTFLNDLRNDQNFAFSREEAREEAMQGVSLIRGGAQQDAAAISAESGNTTAMAPAEIPLDGTDVDEERTVLDQVPDMPTIAQYFKFALPCLGLWIAGPLLSLVDTSFVGLSGASDMSAKRLAALGPATTFMDGATYLFAFLNVATTNLYSSARASSTNLMPRKVSSDQGGEQGPVNLAAESVVRTAARVSLQCGFGIMIFLLVLCKPLLRLYIGSEAVKTTPELLQSATYYVQIRALHMPTSLLLGVLQAALLGAKDSVTPLIAIVYSTLINVSGDYLLVNRFNLGLTGAALATTLAQWASTAALLVPARRKLVHDHHLGIIGKRAALKDEEAATATSTDQSNMVTSKSFLGFAAPVLTLILGKLAAFGFMTNAAAGLPGQPTPLASHQIILSLLFFCSPFLEVISQTAQTFLPPFLAPIQNYMERQQKQGKKVSNDEAILKPWQHAAQSVSTTLLGLGFVAAFVIASIVCLIPAYFGGILTSDITVQRAVQPLAKYLWLGAFAWAPVAVGEGVLLATRQLNFLAVVYLLSTAMLPPALFAIKLRKGTVGQIWLLFGLFQIFRVLCFTGRIWWGPFLMKRLFNRQKTQKEGPSMSISTTPEST